MLYIPLVYKSAHPFLILKMRNFPKCTVFGRRTLIGLNVSVYEGGRSPEGGHDILPAHRGRALASFSLAVVKSGCFCYPISKIDMWYKRFLQTPVASLFLIHNDLQPDHHTCVMTHISKHNSDHVISLHKTHQSQVTPGLTD